MSYKKIVPTVMALGIFAFGGLSCTKDPQKGHVAVKEYNSTVNQPNGNKELRQQIYGYLINREVLSTDSGSYTVNTDKHEIIAKNNSSIVFYTPYLTLTVEIRDKSTNDTLKLWDYNIDGNVDEANYNGLPDGIEGMDERFDKALEIVKPQLEQKIKKLEEEKQLMINRVKDNTKLD